MASRIRAWNIISGHTIKHLMAAVGLWFIVVLLQKRATTAAGPAEQIVRTY